MSKKFYATLTATTLTFALTACQGVGVGTGIAVQESTPIGQIDKRSALDIITQNSQEAYIAQQVLTKYRDAQAHIVAINNVDFKNDKIVIDYIGKPQQLLNSIAIKYGYRYLEYGKYSHTPTVNFTQYYTTPYDALVIINSQLQNTASVGVDLNQKMIVLSYNNSTTTANK